MKIPKQLTAVAVIAIMAAGPVTGYAQGIDSTVKKIDSSAKKVGNKTANIAVQGLSRIRDRVYKGKQGPNGEPVYIDRDDRKFIVDEKGKRVYLQPSQIRDKKQD